MRAGRSLIVAGLALSVLVSGGGPVRAQPADSKLLAEQLFEQGRALVKANKWSEACPKFEASLRYDATLGTRLNLATCYAKIGKLATAWSMLRDAADFALQAGDKQRRDYALKQAAALLPRLPRLTITGPTPQPAGFAVTRDGVPIDLAALGTELYVDPGPHEIAATAPGYEPFKATVTVAEAKSEAVAIGELAPSKTPAEPQPQPQAGSQPQPPAHPMPHPQPEEPGPPPSSSGTRKLVGIGVAVGGAVVMGAGFFFGARASSAYDDARSLCGSELICENEADLARGRDLIDRARTSATLSTVLVIAGAATTAAGVVIWITAPKPKRVETAVVPVATDRELGLAILGRF